MKWIEGIEHSSGRYKIVFPFEYTTKICSLSKYPNGVYPLSKYYNEIYAFSKCRKEVYPVTYQNLKDLKGYNTACKIWKFAFKS